MTKAIKKGKKVKNNSLSNQPGFPLAFPMHKCNSKPFRLYRIDTKMPQELPLFLLKALRPHLIVLESAAYFCEDGTSKGVHWKKGPKGPLFYRTIKAAMAIPF